MVIDVRRGVPLGVEEEQALVAVPTPPPAPGTAFPPRRLTLAGVPVFELNLWCGTCPALVDRLGQPEAADLHVANERLTSGLRVIDDDVLAAYGRVLPASQYTVLLVDVVPSLVTPGSAADYYRHELVATWGADTVDHTPSDRPTPYYRTFEAPVGPERHLYELVVPMVPPEWNDQEQVAAYGASAASTPHTAVAYSLLDVIAPAMDHGTDYHEHWVLTHFLLDGHHKVAAAAAAGRPVRLLSLVDERISLASADELASLVEVRSGPRRARA